MELSRSLSITEVLVMTLVSSPAPIRVRAHTVPVAIYTRVSTANQVGGRFDSCDSQAAVCRDHIAKQSSGAAFPSAPS